MEYCKVHLFVYLFYLGTNIGGTDRPRITSPTRLTSYKVENEVVSLECKSAVLPVPRFTWYKNDEKLSDNDNLFVDPLHGTMSIASFSAREEGEYTCRAENEEGVDLSPIVTLVLASTGSHWNAGRISESRRAGESLDLECRDTPLYKPPGKISWTKDKKEIQPSQRIYVDLKGTLHLAYTDIDDSGLYTCTIYNTVLEVIKLGSEVSVTVRKGFNRQSEPKLVYKTADTTAVVDQDLTLECVFSGSPIPAVTWSHSEVSRQGRTLVIQRVTASKGGMYTCVGRNVVGEVSATINVTLTSGPLWVEAPRDQVVVQGGDVQFTCRATSYSPSPVVITWDILDTSPLNSTRVTIGENRTQLKIRDVAMGDRDCVRCVVRNDVDYISKTACLRVVNESQPEVITTYTTISVTNITDLVTEQATPASSVDQTDGLSTGLVVLVVLLLAAAAAVAVSGIVIWRMRKSKTDYGVLMRFKPKDENFEEKAKRRQTV